MLQGSHQIDYIPYLESKFILLKTRKLRNMQARPFQTNYCMVQSLLDKVLFLLITLGQCSSLWLVPSVNMGWVPTEWMVLDSEMGMPLKLELF